MDELIAEEKAIEQLKELLEKFGYNDHDFEIIDLLRKKISDKPPRIRMTGITRYKDKNKKRVRLVCLVEEWEG